MIIKLRQNNKNVACAKIHRSILDALEMHLVPVNFQCRAGYCGACRLRLLYGKVKYNLTPLAFIHKGDILPCCCLPVEDVELAL
ncbi:class I ribonucleotide reductase maintenance protein YfaE [Candidatus Palibaumannia cicadellinicola]|uniref:Ferredoxin n=1 Tax=Candidatus Palibaumannia cicadellinicola TaxID=186490 RepID=A0A0K2BKK7_9GAMM|nr:class I ribonucleotide reductase maintenance protein YfaE [Candidatus Baumannia cicadellinicola]AKZ65926.1 Ferredoxin [Candidatus Baumannia cicadellinicola]